MDWARKQFSFLGLVLIGLTIVGLGMFGLAKGAMAQCVCSGSKESSRTDWDPVDDGFEHCEWNEHIDRATTSCSDMYNNGMCLHYALGKCFKDEPTCTKYCFPPVWNFCWMCTNPTLPTNTPGGPTNTPGSTPIPTQPLCTGQYAYALVYVFEDLNNNGVWDSNERQVFLNVPGGDPLLGNASLRFNGGLNSSWQASDLTFSQSQSSLNYLALCTLPTNPWNNNCQIICTNTNPPLTLSQHFSQGWEGWPGGKLREGWSGGANCGEVTQRYTYQPAGTYSKEQFWFFQVPLYDCTAKNGNFWLEGLPNGVTTRPASTSFSPWSLYGENTTWPQAKAVAIPVKGCVPSCVSPYCGQWNGCGGAATETPGRRGR